MQSLVKGGSRDRRHAETPLRCPVCGGELRDVVVRDLGGITADIVWQLHAGECPEHGWFQTEIVSRPPREIFAVDRPFGIARRIELDGEELYSIPTVWMFESARGARIKVDPFDAHYWRPQRFLRRS